MLSSSQEQEALSTCLGRRILLFPPGHSVEAWAAKSKVQISGLCGLRGSNPASTKPPVRNASAILPARASYHSPGLGTKGDLLQASMKKAFNHQRRLFFSFNKLLITG